MNGWELRASALEEQAGRDAMTCCQRWPEGSGVVIGSGGSSGGHNKADVKRRVQEQMQKLREQSESNSI